MKNNLSTVQIPGFDDLSKADLVFVITHEVLHRVGNACFAAKMGEEVQQLPVDHVALLEQSPATIEATRLLNNYASGMENDIDPLMDAILALDMPLMETVETLTRYSLIRHE